jgi:hypothetical protein
MADALVLPSEAAICKSPAGRTASENTEVIDAAACSPCRLEPPHSGLGLRK